MKMLQKKNSVSNETQTEVIASGMNDYITKSFNPDDLFKAFIQLILEYLKGIF